MEAIRVAVLLEPGWTIARHGLLMCDNVPEEEEAELRLPPCSEKCVGTSLPPNATAGSIPPFVAVALLAALQLPGLAAAADDAKHELVLRSQC